MEHAVVQVGTFPSFMLEAIAEHYQVYCVDTASTEQLASASAAITRSNQKFPEHYLERMPNVGLIATCGVGYDQIPLAAAKERGIIVTNTPDIVNQPVAELTVGLILSLLRKISAADSFVKSGAWAHDNFPMGEVLAGKKVGIVGLGRIGKTIAELLTPFQVELAYFGRHKQDVPYQYFAELTALAEHSDLIIVAAPANPQTHHLINAPVLAALGKQGYLINIARGALVDEEALIDALQEGGIAGAALDVFHGEPDIDKRWFSLDNVVLTPHVGGATVQSRAQMVAIVLENLERFFSGQAPLTPVLTN